MLVRIVSPKFVAGIIIKDNQVIRTAPILHFMLGWDLERALRYCHDKFWKYELMDERIGAS